MRSSGVDERAEPCLAGRSLRLVHVACGVCGADDPEPVAVGEVFEYATSDETFLIVRCRACGLLYLNPRPAEALDADRVLVYEADAAGGYATANIAARIHRHLAARLPPRSRRLRAGARVLELGSGDGSLAAAGLADASFDVVLARRTLENSADPAALLLEMRRLLRPGGVVLVVLANADSPASRIFRDRYWSGYRFPRAWNLFTRDTLSRLALNSGLRVKTVATRADPLAWLNSIRNALLDARAPHWLVERFGGRTPAALAFFTVVDSLAQCAGSGSLLLATLERPPL